MREKPWTSDGYFDDADAVFRSTLWHEFGHHIHQQRGVGTLQDYKSPPLERKLIDLVRESPKPIVPTRYAATNSKEWFAESYSLHKLDRSDLIDQRLRDLIAAIEAGESI